MTREEFNNVSWGANSKCKVSGSVPYDVVSVNFVEALVGLNCYDDVNDLSWYRCESVELVDYL